jgi:predicted nucleic acid-binding Zn ribbon protein
MRVPPDLNRSRSKRTMPLSEAIGRMIKKNAMTAEFKRQSVISHWPQIVGEIMAKRTGDVRVSDKTLIITVNSAPMRHQMMVNKTRIIALVNTFIGEPIISDIFIQ